MRCSNQKRTLIVICCLSFIVISFIKLFRNKYAHQVPINTASATTKETRRVLSHTVPKVTRGKRTSVSNTSTSPLVKTILFYSAPEYLNLQKGGKIFESCNVSNCVLTTDNHDIMTSHAVIFIHTTLPSVPPPKKKGQIWIFTSSESPFHTSETVRQNQWKGKFNWTMSYRRHSDFFFGYGYIVTKETPPQRHYSKVFDQKDKDVAWIVSHCSTLSRREEYVREMQKYISVDIYGKCGHKNCEVYKGNENDTCHSVISKKYKFYLSFENNLCKDYTTEKFFFPFEYDQPIVPVARGAFNMREYVPREAYIDAMDFASAKELARYLAAIAADKKAYIKMLKSKDKYSSKTSPQTFKESMCLLCAAVHKHVEEKIVNIDDVIFNNQCKHPSEIVDRHVVGLEQMGKIVSNLKDMV